jgi:hypothetical protein
MSASKKIDLQRDFTADVYLSEAPSPPRFLLGVEWQFCWFRGGRYTDFLRVDFFFWGIGGLSAFSKAELKFPILIVEPPACDMRNLYTNSLIVQKSMVYAPLFHSNFFHKEPTLLEKSIPFS